MFWDKLLLLTTMWWSSCRGSRWSQSFYCLQCHDICTILDGTVQWDRHLGRHQGSKGDGCWEAWRSRDLSNQDSISFHWNTFVRCISEGPTTYSVVSLQNKPPAKSAVPYVEHNGDTIKHYLDSSHRCEVELDDHSSWWTLIHSTK